MSSIIEEIVDETELDENLHKWFKEKWVRCESAVTNNSGG